MLSTCCVHNMNRMTIAHATGYANGNKMIEIAAARPPYIKRKIVGGNTTPEAASHPRMNILQLRKKIKLEPYIDSPRCSYQHNHMRAGGRATSHTLGTAARDAPQTLTTSYFTTKQLCDVLGIPDAREKRRIYDVLALLRVLGLVQRVPIRGHVPVIGEKKTYNVRWSWTERGKSGNISLNHLIAPQKSNGLDKVAYDVLNNICGRQIDYDSTQLHNKVPSGRRIYTVIALAEGMGAIVCARRRKKVCVWDKLHYMVSGCGNPLAMDVVAPARILPDAGLA